MFKITTEDFDRPGSMHYVNVTFNGERLPTNGPGLILSSTDSEEYLQEVLGPILQEAFDRGFADGREEGIASGRAEVRHAVHEAIR